MAEQVPPQVAPGLPPEAPQDDSKKGFAIASLVIGILNLCASCFPICGGPLGIAGIILGVLGLKSSQRTLAIVGIVLSGLTLLFTIGWFIYGLVAGSGDIFNEILNEIY